MSALLAATAGESRANFCGLNCTREEELKGILAATEANKGAPGPKYCSGGAKGAIDAGEAAITGARRVMAMIYGSCEVLKQPIRTLIKAPNEITSGYRRVDYPDGDPSFRRVITDKATVLKQHPYLRDRQAPGCDDRKVCADSKARDGLTACQKWSCGALEHPPLYQYGAKPVGPEMSVRQNESNKFAKDFWKKSPGIDCSSFVSLALSSMGLKMFPDAKSVEPADQFGSSSFTMFGRGQRMVERKGRSVAAAAETCFETVVADGGLKPGDVLSINGHVAMIDTVGADPFNNSAEVISRGMSEWSRLLTLHRSDFGSKVKGCRSKSLASMLASVDSVRADRVCLTEAAQNICDAHHGSKDRPAYNVTMIHSTGNGNVGVQREKFKSAFSPQSLLRATMVLKAEVDCSLRLKQEWLGIVGAKSDPELSAWAAISGYEKRVKARGGDVIRHRSSDPRCLVSPNDVPKVDGWECTSCCNTASTYEQMTGGSSAE